MSGGDLSSASDRVLARRAGLGDNQAFAELFNRLFVPTLRYALHMLDGDEQLAEDALQDAWIKAWRGLAKFQGQSAVQTWLFTIVAHEVRDVRRRKRPIVVDNTLLEPLARKASASASVSASVDPPQVLLQHELLDALKLALSELPSMQRACWLLREIEEFSYDKIARILDTTPGVVRGQLHRARRDLAIRMEQWR